MGVAYVSFGSASSSQGFSSAGNTLFRKDSGEILTTNASTSVATAGSAGASGNKWSKAVRIVLTVDGFIEIGDAPVAVKTGDSMFALAGQEYSFAIFPGERVAVIDA